MDQAEISVALRTALNNRAAAHRDNAYLPLSFQDGLNPLVDMAEDYVALPLGGD